MATNEALMQDDELDALMAELEAETADMVTQPVVSAALAPVSTPEPEVVKSEPEPVKPVVAQTEKEAPWEDKTPTNSEDDLEAMLAEIDAQPEEPKLASAPAPELKEVVAPPVEAEKKIQLVTTTPAAKVAASEPVATSATPAPKATLKHYIDADRFARDMKISETTLDKAMMEQASLRAYHGSEAAYAEAQHARVKRRFEVKEAELYAKHRRAFAESGEKATERMIEVAVKLDPSWIAGVNTVVEAETVAAICKTCSLSLNDRRDMIIQLGADRREEGKGAARILASANNYDDTRQRAMDAARQLQNAG
ncbi:hypothetical protein RGU72_04585 [Undibacterium sp. 5I1]|uniref:hypothetical protein n=1 Tax=unclassified Undibacterium TaxID=2630295 RepID=UPI002AB35324|nr:MULTISPECIES: hypothetical protein [unclassified Undibacterium]MDY7537528.1 hypothetical protein [Undibacterium sp. 5I1]MEB0232891.1 hypothetical protein [Undibacterium sp. 10I3]MEB0256263.1 hypothetical protein [Undibacterium sp. 5I1]